MNAENKNLLFVILAIIGGIVVLGFVLKVAFKLIGLAIILGLGAALYFAVKNKFGGGNAR